MTDKFFYAGVALLIFTVIGFLVEANTQHYSSMALYAVGIFFSTLIIRNSNRSRF